MISNRDIKEQMDEITEQNLALTEELQQIKQLLKEQSRQKDQNKDQNQNRDQNQQGQNQNQDQDQDQNQQMQHSQNNQQDQDTNAGSSQSSDNRKHIKDIASDFSKLKDLTTSLEMKMQEYISSNSKKSSLTNEDVVSLILNMMNGMIDWTMDMVSQQQGGNKNQLH